MNGRGGFFHILILDLGLIALYGATCNSNSDLAGSSSPIDEAGPCQRVREGQRDL